MPRGSRNRVAETRPAYARKDAMNTLHETIDLQKPITLVELQAFLKLPIKERMKIMAKQAREMAADYKAGEVEDLETGEFVEY
jgi:hypothetical protein